MSTSSGPVSSMSWIRMELRHDTGKTKVWDVLSKETNIPLGQVRWFGRWRKYAFFPNNDTVFEPTCLNELAGFCQEQTAEWRKAKKGAG